MTAWGQLASERVLRSLMKSIAERLKPGNKLSAKQVMTLLREQARLADTLREVVSARQAKREAQERERARNIQIANTPTEAKKVQTTENISRATEHDSVGRPTRTRRCKIVVVTINCFRKGCMDAEHTITLLERDLDDLRRELDEVTRRLAVVERRADRAYNFLSNRMQSGD